MSMYARSPSHDCRGGGGRASADSAMMRRRRMRLRLRLRLRGRVARVAPPCMAAAVAGRTARRHITHCC